MCYLSVIPVSGNLKMAEGGADSWLFGVGRGKYLMQFSNTKLGQSEIDFSTKDHKAKENHMVHDGNQTFPVTSTPRPDKMEMPGDRDVSDLGVLVEELGRKIGESVTARLLSEGGFAGTSNKTSTTNSQCANLDLSQLNVILKSDEKEPPVFRGDNLGRCDVQEWVDMMQLYLQKRNVKIPNQADEIISHLMGRARDVVKVTLRSNPTLDCKTHPELIYSILKQHFSNVSYSSMPLADFYSTLPRHGENPVDYWLRLNKAADIADECLRAQGRCMDNLNSEVAMMFVRNCPDTDLARTFKVRPLENWTAKDVQELLDSFQRDSKLRASTNEYAIGHNAQISMHSYEHVNAGPESLVTCFKQGTSGSHESKSDEKDQSSLNRMADMLAQLIDVLKKREESKSEYVSAGRTQGKTAVGQRDCKICGDSSHTTIDHCRADHLCFRCHVAGHSKRDCTKKFTNSRSASNSPGGQGN